MTTGNTKFDLLLSQARIALDSDEKHRARQLIEKLISWDPKNEELYLLLSKTVKGINEAISCLDWGLKSLPKNPSLIKAIQDLQSEKLEQQRLSEIERQHSAERKAPDQNLLPTNPDCLCRESDHLILS